MTYKLLARLVANKNDAAHCLAPLITTYVEFCDNYVTNTLNKMSKMNCQHCPKEKLRETVLVM